MPGGRLGEGRKFIMVKQAEFTSEQVSRLPRWAQTHIARLERQLAESEAKNAELLSDRPGGEIFVDVFSGPGKERAVGWENDIVRIQHPEEADDYIDFRRDGDSFVVMSASSIAIHPSASNCIIIDTERGSRRRARQEAK